MTARETCPYCGGDAIAGTTCPKSIACPTCDAAPGASCRRPSGHRAAAMHAARVELAEQADAAAAPAYLAVIGTPELERITRSAERNGWNARAHGAAAELARRGRPDPRRYAPNDPAAYRAPIIGAPLELEGWSS